MRRELPFKEYHLRILKLLAHRDEKEILKMVQERALRPDEWIPSTVPGEKFKLLPAAIERDWTELSIYLIRRGVNINEYSESVTPLMMACEIRNHFLIDALLAAGADPNLKSRRSGECNG